MRTIKANIPSSLFQNFLLDKSHTIKPHVRIPPLGQQMSFARAYSMSSANHDDHIQLHNVPRARDTAYKSSNVIV